MCGSNGQGLYALSKYIRRIDLVNDPMQIDQIKSTWKELLPNPVKSVTHSDLSVM